MQVWELILAALALSMDAFAVSICKGLATDGVKPRHMVITGAWFGGFQALMPLIGYFIGKSFSAYIESFDHWLAFLLLGLIGANMIKESLSGECDAESASFGVKTMFLMALATSIDALAVGVTYALLPDVSIWLAVALIGVITFTFSALGVKFGAFFGAKYKKWAEFAGGAVLILMGLKILLEHTGVINF